MSYAVISSKRFRTLRAIAHAGIGLSALLAAEAQAQDATAVTSPPTGTAAGAATTPMASGGDIVVTATRRATSLQNTPVAVSVTTGQTLSNYHIESFQGLTRVEPSLVVNNQGISGNQFIIRGILSDIGSTTGFYVDDVPLVGGQAIEGNGDGKPGLRLHDIERIEVLKGPQGTLFGSGSMAGTLRIITNKPKLDVVEGGVEGSAGGLDGGKGAYDGDAYVNVPINRMVAIRAVTWGEFGGGYIDHDITTLDGSSTLDKHNVNGRTVWGGRVEMLVKPSDSFSILFSATHQQGNVDDTQAWTLGQKPYVSTLDTVEPYKDNYDLYSATATYDVGVGSFTAIGSYGNQHVFHPEDSTSVGLGLAGSFDLVPFKTVFTTLQTFKDYTGEVRFASKLEGPLQFVTGAYYEHDLTDGTSAAVRADDVTGEAACYTLEQCENMGLRQPGFSAPGVPASNLEYDVFTRRVVKQWAAYGQADLKILSNLTATAGIRYYHADISDYALQVQDIAGPPDFAVPVPVPSWAANGLITTPYVTQDDSAKQHSPSYNFSLLWQATHDLSVYARVASGFRIGGTNNVASLAGEAGISVPASYGSDKLWSYELGAKAYVLDHHLYLDGAIYEMDWNHQQLAATDPSGAFDYVLNAGKTRIRGAEFKATYSTAFGLSLGGGFTYTDAKLREDLDPAVIAAGTIGFKGDRVPRVPRWTLAGQAEYDYSVGEDRTLYLQSDANYRGSSHYSFNEENTFDPKLPSFFLIGAKLGYRTGPFDIAIFGENLTNKAAIYGLDAGADGIKAYSPDPRTVGVQVKAHF